MKVLAILIILVGTFLLSFKMTSAEAGWVNPILTFLGTLLAIQGAILLARKKQNNI
ncbi:MAG TPA: hypothetical protein VNR38_22010 [Ureibacillus sp.]|nr:hypothetical protein [Ureibacillus sp.]